MSWKSARSPKVPKLSLENWQNRLADEQGILGPKSLKTEPTGMDSVSVGFHFRKKPESARTDSIRFGLGLTNFRALPEPSPALVSDEKPSKTENGLTKERRRTDIELTSTCELGRNYHLLKRFLLRFLTMSRTLISRKTLKQREYYHHG